MNLEIQCLSGLPRSGWVAIMRGGSASISVFLGAAVDYTDESVVEGAWNGDFHEMQFDRADLFSGSGLICRDADVLFCTASHNFDRLVSTRRGNELWMSNSLVLLMSVCGASLAPRYLGYDDDLRSFIRGLSKRARTLPLANGDELRLHYVSTIRVTADLELTETIRPSTPEFQGFEDYWAYLCSEFGRMARNASDRDRRSPASPLGTVSSGYDSPATAVIAKRCGADSAVTFASGRDEFGVDSDSGERIGQILGLNVTTFDRLSYLARHDYPEAEFLATGAGGGDVVISAFEDAFRDKCVFTGFLGDTLWSRVHPDPSLGKDFAYMYPGGGSLTEFRVRVGFVHVPVPLMTLRSHDSVARISESTELDPWSTGIRGYDRPIPRRIVESEGVPRELFGQAKNAVNQPFFQAMHAGSMLSSSSMHDLREFWARGADGSLDPAGPIARLYNRSLIETGIADRIRDRGRKTRFARRIEPFFARMRRRSTSGACFHWGLSRSILRIPNDALHAIR